MIAVKKLSSRHSFGLLLLFLVGILAAPPRACAADPLVPTHAVWKYQDSGIDLEPGWRLPSFDDASWPSGPAPLGYGDGDEATVISYGPNAANKPITAYFRLAFDIAELSALNDLVLSVLDDDGVALYLNGIEIYRHNLPAGPLFDSTFASSLLEKSWISAPLDGTALISGRNVLAAEVHQWIPGSSDLAFALELRSGNGTPPVDDLPVVTVEAVDNIAAEQSPLLDGLPNTGLWRITRSGSVAAVLVVNLNYAGSAESGHDTVALPASVEIAAGHASVEVIVEAIDDSLSEPPETIVVQLVEPACAHQPSPGPGCYRVGASSQASITIADNDPETPPIPGGLVLIAANSVWKYLDDGSDQGGAWSGAGFDDSSWASGPAQLGYGDGDEATIVNYGPHLGSKYPTIYFRHAFEVADASALSNLVLRVLRDDGVAVYLNGVEIFRNNLPGIFAYDTFASSVAVDENAYLETAIFSSALVSGRNVIAAEVHQVNSVSSDLGFDLDLRAGGPGAPDDLPVVTVESVDPAAAEQDPALDSLPNVGVWRVARTGATNDALLVQLSYIGSAQNGVDVILLPVNIEIPAGQSSLDLTVEVIDDALVEGTETIALVLPAPACAHQPEPAAGCYRVGSAGRATISIADNESEPPPPATETNVLIATGASWKYLDDGSDQGNAWRNTGFDDSSWASGPAQLGYGDGDEMTLVSAGPDQANRYITTYFRHDFNLANPSEISSLALRVLRDDGVAVYLNGTLVFLNNLPAGELDFHTWATTVAGDENTYLAAEISAAALRVGRNVIAAEIHQVNPNSSDIGFDLALLARSAPTPPAAPVAMELLSNPSATFPERVHFVINGGATGIYILETSTDLVHWMEVQTMDGSELGQVMTSPVSRQDPCRFYRVRAIMP